MGLQARLANDHVRAGDRRALLVVHDAAERRLAHAGSLTEQ
jgi:hypothetical protein